MANELQRVLIIQLSLLCSFHCMTTKSIDGPTFLDENSYIDFQS